MDLDGLKKVGIFFNLLFYCKKIVEMMKLTSCSEQKGNNEHIYLMQG